MARGKQLGKTQHAPKVHRAVVTRTVDDFESAFWPDEQPVDNAVVMTMGALHEGHAALIRAARKQVGRDGRVAVTVFVNPLQFGAGEDLERYPRSLDDDVLLAEANGADVVFAPSVDEVYPNGEPQVRMAAGPMGERYEGATRPGHFDGVLTVVAKLLHITDPDFAFFGEKDAQQLAVVRRMVADLDFDVEIVGVPTVREEDGLALSSRNRYLSAEERSHALALSGALFAGRDAAARGPKAALDAASAVLDAAEGVDLDYLALIDPYDFTEAPDGFRGEAVLAVAAKAGATRLIDNVRVVVR
ncbi:pantoate--beta-alanine ligase [Kitasatospora purpeofusca]|uniref:pantoate--beta-alanine ligase n=1 Tax=Kitasatospora purpeofusca TaxID=67352 RepID=UPI00224D284C|nr:pantoate--beta-alanine ligase [Kitasatospora purpeofusca]MCX4753533.1 pantoate--beta-alanine ligase [Kitasatospora purpeofusca]WSR33025.1 pantoate--beta-alanine ligase [Kitasatospora purpeofusca]WSR41094.1 pantoate--beta-alanine ligase [Kitasatospora purpeofusca]